MFYLDLLSYFYYFFIFFRFLEFFDFFQIFSFFFWGFCEFLLFCIFSRIRCPFFIFSSKLSGFSRFLKFFEKLSYFSAKSSFFEFHFFSQCEIFFENCHFVEFKVVKSGKWAKVKKFQNFKLFKGVILQKNMLKLSFWSKKKFFRIFPYFLCFFSPFFHIHIGIFWKNFLLFKSHF